MANKQIKDFDLKESIDGLEDLLIQDSDGITKRIKTSKLMDSLDLSNYYTKAEVDDLLANTDLSIDMADYYDKTTIDNLLAKKANVSHTHSYNDLTDKPTIPSTTNLATKKELTDGLATKANVSHTHDQYLTEHQDLSDYALKTELPTVPTKTSQLTNDSGFIKSIPSEYITETELSDKSYATETYVQNKIAEASLSGGEVDLSEYATKDDLNTKADKTAIPTKVSQLTNDSGFLTKHQNISSKADKTYVDEIKQNSQEKLREIESKLNQTNAQLSRITVESVEQLKKMEIVVNSIVKLHGYYVGDGVAHNRIIQQKDDGSGIQIANGLYANLLCGNGVDIKLFGGRANMGKDESIEVFDKWVNYVNSSKSKFFQPTTLDTGSSYIIYKPILIKKSFVGIGNPMPSFVYPSAEVGKVVSATEMSHNGIYDFNVKAVFGIKQINYGETTSRFKIENFAVYCTNGDDDTTPAQDYGVYFPEGNSFNMTNVLVVRPNVAGFKFYENWMSTIGTLNSWSSRGDGFHFGDAVKGGNFTSLTIGSLYAHGYTGKGYRFQSLNYSTINSLGSDGARGGNGHAYVFASCHGTSVNSLGCESGNVKNILYIGDCTMTINGLFTLDMTLSESIIEVFSNSQITINNIHHHNGKIHRLDSTSPKSYIIRGDKSQVVINAKEREVTFEDGYKAGTALFGTADVIFNTSDKDIYHKRYVNNRELHPGDDLTESFIDLQNGWGFQMLKLDSSNFVSDFKYEKEWKHEVDVLYIIAQVQGTDGATVVRTENSTTKAIVHLDKKLDSGVITVMMFGRLAN